MVPRLTEVFVIKEDTSMSQEQMAAKILNDRIWNDFKVKIPPQKIIDAFKKDRAVPDINPSTPSAMDSEMDHIVMGPLDDPKAMAIRDRHPALNKLIQSL